MKTLSRKHSPVVLHGAVQGWSKAGRPQVHTQPSTLSLQQPVLDPYKRKQETLVFALVCALVFAQQTVLFSTALLMNPHKTSAH